jgi:ribosomal protein L37AE/L43A
MARADLGYLSRENPSANPCAQCGKPIAAPDWVERGPRCVAYLWQCRACDYRFEAVAFFDASEADRESMAA